MILFYLTVTGCRLGETHRNVWYQCREDSGKRAIIKTPAFRSLVQAVPTDRIAALIMVNWLRSPILDSKQEENDYW